MTAANSKSTPKVNSALVVLPIEADALRVLTPDSEITKSVNVAIPFTALTVVVPDNVPVPDAREIVTSSSLFAPAVLVLPEGLLMVMTGCVPRLVPALGPAGSVENVNVGPAPPVLLTLK